jgi:hypothetical protein
MAVVRALLSLIVGVDIYRAAHIRDGYTRFRPLLDASILAAILATAIDSARQGDLGDTSVMSFAAVAEVWCSIVIYLHYRHEHLCRPPMIDEHEWATDLVLPDSVYWYCSCGRMWITERNGLWRPFTVSERIRRFGLLDLLRNAPREVFRRMRA